MPELPTTVSIHSEHAESAWSQNQLLLVIGSLAGDRLRWNNVVELLRAFVQRLCQSDSLSKITSNTAICYSAEVIDYVKGLSSEMCTVAEKKTTLTVNPDVCLHLHSRKLWYKAWAHRKDIIRPFSNMWPKLLRLLMPTESHRHFLSP